MTDTEKLKLIEEYAEEYFKNSRQYHFVNGGFMLFAPETSFK